MEGRKHAMHNMSSASFWMECDHWYQHKKRAIESGNYVDSESDASRRGTLLHDLIEVLITGYLDDEPLMMENASEQVEARLTKFADDEKWTDAELEDAAEQLSTAFRAVRKLLDAHPEAMVMLELSVPLSHEPESKGYVDLCLVDEKDVFVVDHKFGQVAVDPESWQNTGYSINLVHLLKKKGISIPDDARIHLGINQPRHHSEILFAAPTDQKQLFRDETQIFERVKHQKAGKGLQSPETLSTCQWCDFRMNCSARAELVDGTFAKIGEVGAAIQAEEKIEPSWIEEIVRSKSAIEAVIKECVERVKADPDMFPHWRRTQVQNARVWNMEVMDLNEIMAQLREVGILNPLELMSPASVKKRWPDAEAKVDELTVDTGFHIRLKYDEKAAAEAPSADEQREDDARVRRPPPPTFIARVEAAMRPPADAPAEPEKVLDEMVETAKKRRTPKAASEEAPAEKPKRGRGRPKGSKKGAAKARATKTLDAAREEVKERALKLAEKSRKRGAK